VNIRKLLQLAVLVALAGACFPLAAGAEEYNHYFSKRFGDSADQYCTAVATDVSGDVVIAGYFLGTVNFGGGALTSAGGADIFIAKFDRFGNHLWSKRFGDALYNQNCWAVAISPSDCSIIITGALWGSVDFGGGALMSKGGSDIFVARFDKSGTHIWSKLFGDASDQTGNAVAADAWGNFAIAGYFEGTADFGGGVLTSAGERDIFIATFRPDDSSGWSKRFGDATSQFARGVAYDNIGSVLLVGDFYGVVNFGGEPHTSAGSADIFLAKFDHSGNFVWSRRFGDAAHQYGFAVAVDGSNRVIITGDMQGTVNFGSGALTSAGGTDIYLAKFQSNGVPMWSKRFGDWENQSGLAVATDSEENVIITGAGSGSEDFGGGVLTSAGSVDAFLAAFDASGGHIWSKLYGDASDQSGRGVAADVSGNVIAAGHFQGSMDFGGGALASAGGVDIYLAKLFFTRPRIVSCVDIPHDEGGLLRVRLQSSLFDVEGLGTPITGYTVWREIDAAALSEGAPAAFSAALAPGRGSLTSDRAALLGLPPGSWESVGFAFATQDSFYNFAIPTMADSTGSGIPWETYIVTAHTATPSLYFTSRSADGYSVDNLPPMMPLGLEGEQSYSPEGLALTWTPNGERDLAGYYVYRGASSGFVPGPSNRVAAVDEASFFDDEWDWGGGYHYKVAAVDRHGNESGYALLSPDDITGVETPKAPEASYLSQNFPNPFNPATKIEFGLSAPANVRVRIYDAAGRLVRVLAEGARPAGRYSELWNGRDARGGAVASGIYFYRLEAGPFTKTRKMVLLR
jgi:hypothetical protein